jgi:hypothetical protein
MSRPSAPGHESLSEGGLQQWSNSKTLGSGHHKIYCYNQSKVTHPFGIGN